MLHTAQLCRLRDLFLGFRAGASNFVRNIWSLLPSGSRSRILFSTPFDSYWLCYDHSEAHPQVLLLKLHVKQPVDIPNPDPETKESIKLGLSKLEEEPAVPSMNWQPFQWLGSDFCSTFFCSNTLHMTMKERLAPPILCWKPQVGAQWKEYLELLRYLGIWSQANTPRIKVSLTFLLPPLMTFRHPILIP